MKIGMLAIVSPLETPYIREWLTHHADIGVDEFWLLLNDFTEHQKATFVKQIPSCLTVNLHQANGAAIQCQAYNEVIWNYIMPDPNHPDRLFVLDADEFIKIHPCSFLGRKRPLAEILSNHPHDLALNWRLYGSNGQTHADLDIPVVARFTRCSSSLNRHVKQCLNLNDQVFRYFINPHCLNLHSFDLYGNEVYGPFNQRGPEEIDEIEIAHYATKSREECQVRRTHRRVDNGEMRPDWEAFFREHDQNDISETELDRTEDYL